MSAATLLVRTPALATMASLSMKTATTAKKGAVSTKLGLLLEKSLALTIRIRILPVRNASGISPQLLDIVLNWYCTLESSLGIVDFTLFDVL